MVFRLVSSIAHHEPDFGVKRVLSANRLARERVQRHWPNVRGGEGISGLLPDPKGGTTSVFRIGRPKHANRNSGRLM